MRSESNLINSTIILHIAATTQEIAVYGMQDAVMVSDDHAQMVVKVIECKGY